MFGFVVTNPFYFMLETFMSLKFVLNLTIIINEESTCIK